MLANAALWKALNPDLTIEEQNPLTVDRVYRLSVEDREEQRALLKEDGYCFLPSVLDSKTIDRMFACVSSLIDRKIPPVYCFVYDLFWQLILQIEPVLTDLLGKGYDVIPNAWTWYVDATRPGSYFLPHRDVDEEDFIDEEGMPTLFSLWIPLTDVTTKQSCMYVLPASRDPGYPEEAIGWRKKWQSQGHPLWKVEDLVNIRALPATKGSLLGWNGGVFHWGSKPDPKAQPRVSIGYYFHAKQAQKKHAGLIDLKKPFSLQKRLGVILANFRMYGNSLEGSSHV